MSARVSKPLSRSSVKKGKIDFVQQAQNVAYTYDYRGDGDDVLTFHFRGTTYEVMAAVFRFLCPINGRGVAASYKIRAEHDVEARNGKGYRRIAVSLYKPNLYFASIDTICLLIEARMKAETHTLSVKRMRLDDFLNV